MPSYPADVFVALVGMQGGIDALQALDNLNPGAWQAPEVLAAFSALAEDQQVRTSRPPSSKASAGGAMTSQRELASGRVGT